MYPVSVLKPESLDGEVLREELLAAGVPVNSRIGAISVDGDTLTVLVDTPPTPELVATITSVVESHTGSPVSKQAERLHNESRRRLSDPLITWLVGEINKLRTHLGMLPYTVADILKALEKQR